MQETKGLYIVQVRYGAEATEGRLYSYYSVDDLQVGDLVEVPTKNGLVKARVLTTGVTEAEVASFKHAMRTIPAGSVIHEKLTTEEKLDDLDRMVNLCDTCKSRQEYPMCSPGDVEFGDGKGLDNTIKCSKYEIRPELEEMEEGLNAEGLTLVGAEKPTAETAIIRIAPDKDEGYIALLTETTKLLEYSTKLVIKGLDDKKAATNDLIIMSDLGKRIETVKKEWLGPIDEHRGDVFNKFKQLTEPLAQAVKQTKAAMIEYDRQQESKRLELEEIARKERELEEAKARAENRAPVEVETVAIPEQDTGQTRSELGLASTVTTYKAKVVDFTLLSDDYKLPDMAKLNRVVNAAKGKIEIPGVEIETEYNLRTNRRTK